MLGEFPQAYGDLYDNSIHPDIDGGRCKNYGRVTFSACLGIETSQTGAAQ
jgi:hypothetical protein